jgi:tetratricopeptide (TPR) repeat protein
LITLGLASVFALIAGAQSLDEGKRALAEFRVMEAIALLEKAEHEGPYDHAHLVELWEQLGIAYAYEGKQDDAIRAFAMLLQIDPAHLVRYNLSPKVTLVFEEARHRAEGLRPPAIELSWPKDRMVRDAVQVDVEVIADVNQLLASAALFYRLQGDVEYRSLKVDLGPNAAHAQIPALAAAYERDAAMEIHAIAYDERGNEVLLWASGKAPREIHLRYEAPEPWYGRWWVWVAAGAVVAAGSGTAVFLSTHNPTTFSLDVMRK